MTATRQQLSRGAAAGLEAHLISAALEVASKTLRRSLSGPTRCGIHTTPTQGDTLICNFESTNAREPVWLWDTSGTTAFIIGVPASVLDPARLPAYIEELVVWDQSPVHLKSAQLVFYPGPGSAIALGDHRTQERGMLRWWIEAATQAGQSYIAVGVTKAFFGDATYGGLYRAEALVPERFPPLQERLRGFGRGALFAELARSTTSTTRREQILMAELVSRGPLGPAEVRSLVLGNLPDWRRRWERLGALLSAAAERQAIPSLAPALESMCLSLGPRDLDEGAISSLFGSMGKAEVDFNRVALHFLERNRFEGASLSYLKFYSRDPATLSRLAVMKVPPQLEEIRRIAVETIDRRIKGTLPK